MIEFNIKKAIFSVIYNNKKRWLPYEKQKRRVIFNKQDDKISAKPVRNLIVQWETPKHNVKNKYIILYSIKIFILIAFFTIRYNFEGEAKS